MNEQERKIREGEGRVTSIRFDQERSLLLSYYDFSSEAQSFVGSDVAYDMIIPYESLPDVFRLIGIEDLQPDMSNDRILEILEMQFRGFFTFKHLLEDAKIKHKCERDHWA